MTTKNKHVEKLKIEMESVLTPHYIPLDRVLDKFGVPSGPINDIGQAATHPQTIARNMIVSVDDPITGPMKVAGTLSKFQVLKIQKPRTSAKPRSEQGTNTARAY
ncbi:MAG: hypothetical protein CM15mP62_19080 [Rhodospirillaceae bacterium]|nr:MAG: hypothetical protein CM15mP62_19080 [Rhodospirillaceae bacterium]